MRNFSKLFIAVDILLDIEKSDNYNCKILFLEMIMLLHEVNKLQLFFCHCTDCDTQIRNSSTSSCDFATWFPNALTKNCNIIFLKRKW